MELKLSDEREIDLVSHLEYILLINNNQKK